MQKYKKQIILVLSMITVIIYFLLGEEYPSDLQEILDVQIPTKDVSGVHVVSRVIDGDTFDISTGERIRMIGIDTPERGKDFYNEAKDRLEELIGDKEVVLVKDVSETDRYGRLLRHVYYEDVWINRQMIDEGFAKFVTFPPDVMHVDDFQKSQNNAREKGIGLWSE